MTNYVTNKYESKTSKQPPSIKGNKRRPCEPDEEEEEDRAQGDGAAVAAGADAAKKRRVPSSGTMAKR
jgi:hypothetical protein